MAKIIKYKTLSCEVNHGTKETPEIEQIFSNVTMGWNEANEEIAKKEAYNGDYTIEDDGQPEPEIVHTVEDRVEVLEETSATKDEVQAVWDQLETAYQEGVDSI